MNSGRSIRQTNAFVLPAAVEGRKEKRRDITADAMASHASSVVPEPAADSKAWRAQREGRRSSTPSLYVLP